MLWGIAGKGLNKDSINTPLYIPSNQITGEWDWAVAYFIEISKKGSY